MDKSADLPESIRRDVERVSYHLFSGNPLVPGCPLVYGWTFRLRRYTTVKERAWLKANGWRFSGGRWSKADNSGGADVQA